VSDESDAPAISALRAVQASRLTRLRVVLEIGLAEAAEMAGMSRHQWSRMERGLANLDGTHLARFVQRVGIPGEYVLTGSFMGLSDQLIRNLAEREARERAVAAGHMAALPDRPRRGRPRQKNKARIEPEGSVVAAVSRPAAFEPAASVTRAPRKVS